MNDRPIVPENCAFALFKYAAPLPNNFLWLFTGKASKPSLIQAH
jgi:hypothetical protein